jgi:hypothetical protein
MLNVGLITIARMGDCYADSGADTCDQTQQSSQRAGAPIPAPHNCIPPNAEAYVRLSMQRLSVRVFDFGRIVPDRVLNG